MGSLLEKWPVAFDLVRQASLGLLVEEDSLLSSSSIMVGNPLEATTDMELLPSVHLAALTAANNTDMTPRSAIEEPSFVEDSSFEVAIEQEDIDPVLKLASTVDYLMDQSFDGCMIP